jgi:phosphoribosylformylglycinamidine synthase I
MTVRFLVLTGDGINCERESALACETAGGSASIIHINDLLDNPEELLDFDALIIPGGFSFGDELGSGTILALKLKNSLTEVLNKFVLDKKPILGICNGFQVLTKLGLLPKPFSARSMALAHNKSDNYIDKWVNLKTNENSVCKWTSNTDDRFSLPIRHGEGRVVFREGHEVEIYRELSKNGQIVFSYCEDINGSYENIAAICDPGGTILGMMPHPEAAIFKETCPESSLEGSGGLQLFKNIIQHIEGTSKGSSINE